MVPDPRKVARLSRDCLFLVLEQLGTRDLARACRVHSSWLEVARGLLAERKRLLHTVADATPETVVKLLFNLLVWREDVCPDFARRAESLIAQEANRLRAITRLAPSQEHHLALLSFCTRVLEGVQGRNIWSLETKLWRYVCSLDVQTKNVSHYESSLRQATVEGWPDEIAYCVELAHFLRDMNRIDELSEFARQSVERFSSENLGPSMLMEILETYAKDPTYIF